MHLVETVPADLRPTAKAASDSSRDTPQPDFRLSYLPVDGDASLHPDSLIDRLVHACIHFALSKSPTQGEILDYFLVEAGKSQGSQV